MPNEQIVAIAVAQTLSPTKRRVAIQSHAVRDRISVGCHTWIVTYDPTSFTDTMLAVVRISEWGVNPLVPVPPEVTRKAITGMVLMDLEV